MNEVASGRGHRPPKPRDAPLVFAVVTVALGSAFVALLWVSSYAKVKPTLGGFPFFYWYSLLWLLINAGTQTLAYQLLVARPRRRQRQETVG
ncbi:MAG: DUF3311 domain-containing protein [Acidimicrobiaceae bacterium]|nr:DUF3311 domain-containing protein [Acidimicrobiaceae bacterium]